MTGSSKVKKVLIWPVHRGLTLNNILSRLEGYLTLIDTSSGYYKMKLDMQSSYLTTLSCLFGGHRYIRLLLGVLPNGNMFQRKMNKLFHGLSNVFDIADDILITGFDDLGRDHNEMLEMSRKSNLKLNKDM